MRRLIATVLLWPALAGAATWYVRPAGGSYGAEDGTSYADAFDGDTDAWANSGHIDSGDTLYVCGTHYEPITVQDGGVTIRGDCPGDPGSVDGADTYDHTGWTLTSGEYCRDLTATPAIISGWSGTWVEKNGEHLTLGTVGSLASGEWGCNRTSTFPGNGRTCDSAATTVCIKDAPAVGDVYRIPERSRLVLINPTNASGMDGANITIRNLTLRNGWENGISAYSDNHDRNYGTITVTGIECDWLIQCLHVYGNDSTAGDPADTYWTTVVVSDVTCTNVGGECIYAKDFIVSALTVAGITCEGANNGWAGRLNLTAFAGDCVDVAQPMTTFTAYTPTVDVSDVRCVGARGAGVYMGYNGVVRDSYIEDCDNPGSSTEVGGINLDATTAGTTIVRGNRLRFTAAADNPINLSGNATNDPVFRVYANVIEHTDVATSKCINKISTHFTGIHITNNTLVGCGYGFYTSTNPETPASSTFSNNALFGPAVAWHIQKATITGLTAANNAVFGAGASPYCTGTTPTCDSTPQAQFTGTITADPLLDADGKPAPASPLVNAGACPLSTGCAHGDYRGRTRGTDPDVGAYELSSRDAVTARTASAAREAGTRVAATSRAAQ